jgi:hypothetical protein
MKKLLTLLFVGALISMWNGCTDDPLGATNITITIDAIAAIVAGSNGSSEVSGEIDSDEDITGVTLKVLDASDVDVSTNFVIDYISSGFTVKKKVDLKTDLAIKVKANAGTAAGIYKFQITAISGEYSTTSAREFTVTSGNSLVEATALLGNTANSNAGSIDLDNGTTYDKTAAASQVGSIDICFANGSSIDRFYVPKAAKYGTVNDQTINTTAAGFNFTSSWPLTGYSETVRIVTITAAQYDAATTAAGLATLYNAGTPKVYVPVLAVNDACVVLTSSGTHVAIKVTALTAGTAGTVNFKYAK